MLIVLDRLKELNNHIFIVGLYYVWERKAIFVEWSLSYRNEIPFPFAV
jgi:hypothetical protein